MLQGCTSDAGKSVLTAGLCRIIARKGISVAPFKPQNMALNSAVTIDGGEIGRSQAVQAKACFLEAHTDMNPVLLKPSSDTGAQVIVHGHAIDAMQAGQFHDYKKFAMQAVLESHSRLSEQYQNVIVEGAGSPAEINLRANDIANMGFAEAVDCPVVLIADIDRGGVFAHLVGTLALLSPSEQDRIIGFIINRFRGDISLLKPGLDWLEMKTGKPVLGVMPYLKDFYLDAEDAISTTQVSAAQANKPLNVVVPVLSRISNHTDFDALRMHPRVNLQLVSVDQDLPPTDLIILPGSKNVRADLDALKAAGWQQHLLKHLRYGGKIIGLCGGYQMLGSQLSDPDAIESTLGQTEGFGLLPINTSLLPKKTLNRVSAKILTTLSKDHDSDVQVQGYEIHCGKSEVDYSLCEPLLMLESRQLEGAISSSNNVLGSYLHGLFDQPEVCDYFLAWAGLRNKGAISLENLREQQLERLADAMQKHIKLDFLNDLIAGLK